MRNRPAIFSQCGNYLHTPPEMARWVSRCRTTSAGRGKADTYSGMRYGSCEDLRLPGRVTVTCFDFLFDGSHRFGGDIDEFHTDPHARQAISDLAPGPHPNSRLRQSELDVQNRAFREGAIRVDEHST